MQDLRIVQMEYDANSQNFVVSGFWRPSTDGAIARSRLENQTSMPKNSFIKPNAFCECVSPTYHA